MYKTFSHSTLVSYFNFLKPGLKVGLDRVTIDNFENNLEENIEIIIRKVKNRNYKFTRFKEISRNNRIVYIPTIRDRILIEYLKDKIKQKFKIKQKNRNEIIKDLINVLSEDIDYYVLRIDIKNFFPSITSADLLLKIETSSMLQSNEFYVLKELLSNASKGLPQGLSISNYLSELFLENLDMKLKRIHPRSIIYSRYVDDIILVLSGKFNKNEKYQLHNRISNLFNSYNLKLNETKTKDLEFLKGKKSDIFEFLGYSFQKIKKGNKTKLEVNISGKKLKKYYKKIDEFIYDFHQNKNVDLLFERLLAFTSINKIRKQKLFFRRDTKITYKMSNINFGIVEDYKYANFNSYKKIDAYILHKIYQLRSNFGKDFNRFYKLSVVKSKQKQKLINFEKIPMSTLRSKVYRLDNKLSYIQVLSLNKKELLLRYFNLLNFIEN